ncbi:MAG: MBL fold metallo-hydrolase [Actinomycetia bacterium]|nr:MBL fold metallo-hydrolase [Actinomycetes bacterium]
MKILCAPVGVNQANCYLVYDDERRACAVDPGDEPDRLRQIIEKESLVVEAILVTHGHFDHIGGVKGLVETVGAPVYCGAEVAPVLRGLEECPPFGHRMHAVDASTVKVVGDGDMLEVGSLSVKVISTPGHAPGSLTFEIDGYLFCGDLIFYRSVGRTDLPGGDFTTLLASVEKLARLYPASTPVLPGHQWSTTLGEELAENPFLRGLKVYD